MKKHPLLVYREKWGLTQEELAVKLGVSRQLIGLIESGGRGVTPARALDIEAKTNGEVTFGELVPDLYKKLRRRAEATA